MDDLPEEASKAEVGRDFASAVREADFVRVEKRNALGQMDTHSFPNAWAGIEALLTEERRQALEEAALVCEGEGQPDYIAGGDEHAARIRALSDAPAREQHPDDAGVDRFAAAMKAKLAKKRADGRGGWQDKDDCSQEFLSDLLRGHVEKGDPVDVANFAMMLHQRGEAILSPARAQALSDMAELDAKAGLLDASAQRCAECDCENGGEDCNWIAAGPAPAREPYADHIAKRGEQRTICEECGESNLAHDRAIWTEDGSSSFCPGCAPRSTAPAREVTDGTCVQCGCAPTNVDGLCATCVDERADEAREVTVREADVERVAEAIWFDGYGKHRKKHDQPHKWPDDVLGGSQELFRGMARAALRALSQGGEG